MLETSINGATGVLINVTGAMDLGLDDVETAANIVMEAANPDANIIFGAAFSEEFEDQMRVTVIATGFDEKAAAPAAGAFTQAGDKAKDAAPAAVSDQDWDEELFKIFNKKLNMSKSGASIPAAPLFYGKIVKKIYRIFFTEDGQVL